MQDWSLKRSIWTISSNALMIYCPVWECYIALHFPFSDHEAFNSGFMRFAPEYKNTPTRANAVPAQSFPSSVPLKAKMLENLYRFTRIKSWQMLLFVRQNYELLTESVYWRDWSLEEDDRRDYNDHSLHTVPDRVCNGRDHPKYAIGNLTKKFCLDQQKLHHRDRENNPKDILFYELFFCKSGLSDMLALWSHAVLVKQSYHLFPRNEEQKLAISLGHQRWQSCFLNLQIHFNKTIEN